jgi:hypothetical protein
MRYATQLSTLNRKVNIDKEQAENHSQEGKHCALVKLSKRPSTYGNTCKANSKVCNSFINNILTVFHLMILKIFRDGDFSSNSLIQVTKHIHTSQVCLEINPKKTKYIFHPCYQKKEQNHFNRSHPIVCCNNVAISLQSMTQHALNIY